MATVELRRMQVLDDAIAPLESEAESEGFPFMRRLREEWLSGANRFEGRGEFFLGAWADGRLVAVGGLNIDPYAADAGVGRVRHLYVARSARRAGVGAMLVRRIVDEAAQTFSVLRLRTTTAEGAMFYERLGFERTSEDAATHIIRLRAALSDASK